MGIAARYLWSSLKGDRAIFLAVPIVMVVAIFAVTSVVMGLFVSLTINQSDLNDCCLGETACRGKQA